MKYYYREHLAGYERIKAEGKLAWGELHGGTGFDDFSSRAFLEEALSKLRFSTQHPIALECGCGTGPGACYLAEHGFRVDAVDLIPLAIEMARAVAAERSLDIHYEVADVCCLADDGKKYDLIVDSYCLQCIVIDEDRERVFSAVRARLKPEGYYLVSTAMFDESRFRERDTVVDAHSGVTYNRYGEGLIDGTRGIVYQQLDDEPGDWEGTVLITETWYLPNRRHLKAPELRAEIEAAGFHVGYQDDGLGGNLICKLAW